MSHHIPIGEPSSAALSPVAAPVLETGLAVGGYRLLRRPSATVPFVAWPGFATLLAERSWRDDPGDRR